MNSGVGRTRADSGQRAYARMAGFLYLVVLAIDIAGDVITSAIHGDGGFIDASRSIVAWEPLYRIGLLCSLVGSVSVVVLAVSLYATLKPVNRNLTIMALAFRLAESAIGAMGIATAFSVLQIRLAAAQGSAFDAGQLGALASFSPTASTEVSAIFFCAGSAIFFYVFLKSGYIPRVLSAWGIVASLVYMAVWFIDLAVPNRPGLVVILGSLPILIAEVATAVWLLTVGIRDSTSPGGPVAFSPTPTHSTALEGGR